MRLRWPILLTTLLGASSVLPSVAVQDLPEEVTELRQRVIRIRSGMAAITEAAEYAAQLMTRDTSLRFLTPLGFDPGFSHEFTYRAGGLVQVGNASVGGAPGVVLLPVRSWVGSAFAVAGQVEDWNGMGRAVISVGPGVGKPSVLVGQRFLDNGAAAATLQQAPISGVSNVIVAWTFWAEFVAAASRLGWEAGILRSSAMSGSEGMNQVARFRSSLQPALVRSIPPGQLGTAYLTAVDSLLQAAAQPAHQALVQRAIDSLRAVRRRGGRLLVSSCGHYLQSDLPSDTLPGAPFTPVNGRDDMFSALAVAGAGSRDAMLWFGYAGYDCPNARVSETFSGAGLRVVVVSDSIEPMQDVMAHIPLSWRLPDAVVKVPFGPGSMGATSSVEMALHYLWIRRVLGTP